MHVVFSTKERRNLIPENIRPDLWAYMGGIARNNHFTALCVGGTGDHAHMLLSVAPDKPIAKCVQVVKAGSSKWLHERGHQLFSWQEAYGAFTIGASQLERTIAYIETQAEHHSKVNFQDEFRSLLARYGVSFDERYVWG